MARISMESLMAPGGVLDASGRLVQTLYQAPLQRRQIEEDLRRTREAERTQQVGLQANALQFLISEKERGAAALDEMAAGAEQLAAGGRSGGRAPSTAIHYDDYQQSVLDAIEEANKSAADPFMETTSGARGALLTSEAQRLGLTGAWTEEDVLNRRRQDFAQSVLRLTPEQFAAKQAEAEAIVKQAQERAAAASAVAGVSPEVRAAAGVDASERRLQASRLRDSIEDHRRELARVVGVAYRTPQFLSKDPAQRPRLDTSRLAPVMQTGITKPLATPMEPNQLPAPAPAFDLTQVNADINGANDAPIPVAAGKKADATELSNPDNPKVLEAARRRWLRATDEAFNAFTPSRPDLAAASGTKQNAQRMRDAFQRAIAVELLATGIAPDVAESVAGSVKAMDAMQYLEKIRRTMRIAATGVGAPQIQHEIDYNRYMAEVARDVLAKATRNR